MKLLKNNFQRDEYTSFELRRLFEQRGFKRVKAKKFEDYSLYMDNKNFIASESVITFMGFDGKLLALKPDVTLSIVKNIPENELSVTQKLYYIDEVYRLSREEGEYKAFSQIGVEIIGKEDPFTNLEIVNVALKSLGIISQDFVLDISHLGFVSGLLSQAKLSPSVEKRIIELIHSKNTSDLKILFNNEKITLEHQEKILALVAIHGPAVEELDKAKELICNDVMRTAYEELEKLVLMLGDFNESGKIYLDFSVVNDLDYYNGLIFRGYVNAVPTIVLTGGRYDNLLKKMGKQSCAIGFAVSLDPLATFLKTPKRYDFDILLTYPLNCPHLTLLGELEKLCAEGAAVRLEREDTPLAALDFSYQQHYCIKDGRAVMAKEGEGC